MYHMCSRSLRAMQCDNATKRRAAARDGIVAANTSRVRGRHMALMHACVPAYEQVIEVHYIVNCAKRAGAALLAGAPKPRSLESCLTPQLSLKIRMRATSLDQLCVEVIASTDSTEETRPAARPFVCRAEAAMQAFTQGCNASKVQVRISR